MKKKKNLKLSKTDHELNNVFLHDLVHFLDNLMQNNFNNLKIKTLTFLHIKVDNKSRNPFKDLINRLIS